MKLQATVLLTFPVPHDTEAMHDAVAALGRELLASAAGKLEELGIDRLDSGLRVDFGIGDEAACACQGRATCPLHGEGLR